MEITDRVHVVAHGWEVARVVEPLYELKADKVVLILPENEAFMADFEYDMLEDLRADRRLEVETRRANLYDIDSTVQTVTQAVKDHEDDDVYINVSTGSRIAGIAGMIAAQTSDATPFYVEPSLASADADEVDTPEEPVIPVAGDISELPVFDIQGPSDEQLQVLAYLYGNDGVTKKELIRYAEDEQLPFIADTEAESDEGRYRLLESHIIDPLTGGDYVSVEKSGRQKVVRLEAHGVDALAAFPLEAGALDAFAEGGDRDADDLEGGGEFHWAPHPGPGRAGHSSPTSGHTSRPSSPVSGHASREPESDDDE